MSRATLCRTDMKIPTPHAGPSAITHPHNFHHQALHRYYSEGLPEEPTLEVLSSARLSSGCRVFRPD